MNRNYPKLTEKGEWEVAMAELSSNNLDYHVFTLLCDIANSLRTTNGLLEILATNSLNEVDLWNKYKNLE